MKKILQFSGIISLVLAVVAFILMLATPAMLVEDVQFGGTLAMFGGDLSLAQKVYLVAGSAKLAPLALIAFILVLVGLIIVLAGVVLPLLKINALEKFAGILNLVALVCFVVAGIFMFCVVPSFTAANGFDKVPDGYNIGVGWVFGGIFAIAGGAFAILPAAAAFLGKKK